MKIYTEVSSVIKANYLTGIQRTVIEIVYRLIKAYGDDYTLLFSNERGKYHRVYNHSFLQRFYFSKDDYPLTISENYINVDDMAGDSVFLDLDASWKAAERRNFLYQKLKKRNIKICTYVYDIIPVTHPQFASEENLVYFPQYIGAVLLFSDVIMTSAAYTVGEMKKMKDRIGIPNNGTKFEVIPLGSDFVDYSSAFENDMVSEEAKEIISRGKYLLYVSTIEPRKNHKILIDAFQNDLKNSDINLVLVGRYGWNIEDLKARIESSSLRGKTLFHLSNINNETLRFLYRNAFLVAFPSWVEGYGLPAIEALHYHVPTLLSDITVFREIGRDYCDYFDPSDSTDFSNLVNKYLRDTNYYQQKRERIAEFTPPSWAGAAEQIKRNINSLMATDESLQEICLKQVFCISARLEDLLSSLPFYEHYIPYITELLLVCPKSVKKEFIKRYSGKLSVIYITDDELLEGKPLPEDHTHRNFFLRCLAMKRPELDDFFIMTDDDYRPITTIDRDVFFHDGRMQGYYCFDLDNWKNNVYKPTSFDNSMARTNQFLKNNGMKNMMYASHMPQIIWKKMYLKMLDDYPGIESKGYCEWSTYFNYLVSFYPKTISVHPYATVAFPGNISDWNQEIYPDKYLFENHYSFLYNDGMFSGIGEEFSPGVEEENLEKVIREKKRTEKQKSDVEDSERFRLEYAKVFREYPSIIFNSETREFTLPRFLRYNKDSWNRIPVTVLGAPKGKIGWAYNDQKPDFVMPVCDEKIIYMPFRCVGDHIETKISFFSSDDKSVMKARKSVKLIVV